MRHNYKPIETAPMTGKAIRVLLKDGFGTFTFAPAAWDNVKHCWVNAKTGTRLVVMPIGWTHLEVKKHG